MMSITWASNIADTVLIWDNSINQSTNQSINTQSINQSTNQSINQSVSQSGGHLTGHSVSQSTGDMADRHVNLVPLVHAFPGSGSGIGNSI